MNIFTKNKLIYKNIKAGIIFILVFVVCFSNGKKDVKAEEDVITTHIWATKYDSINHWEYCTLCGEVRNKIAHIWNDTWFLGYESCASRNYCTRICDCGYNFTYRKAHGSKSQVYQHSCKLKHFQVCSACGDWISDPRCYDDEGYLSCKNPGVCKECNFVAKKENHFIITGGYCRDCNRKILEFSDATVEYAPDYSSATIKFTMWTTDPNITLNEKMNSWNGVQNYSSKTWTGEKVTDNKYNYTGVYVFNPNTQHKMTLSIGDVSWGVVENGVGMFIESGLFGVPIWQDHEKPSITSIEQKDQKTYNDWATIKQLTIKGKDNLSAIVNIAIIDKETGDVVFDDAKAPVINGEYTYVCTPPLEGPVEGREYVCIVTDEVYNKLEYPFTIYKTDSRHPIYRSETEYTNWSKTKNIEFLLSDYGSGGVETSLNDQVSYIKASSNGDDYVANYTFAEENYGVTKYSFYMRDGLGNAGRTYVTIGKIDNTRPSISEAIVKKEEKRAIVEVKGDDFSKKLNAQGSGVAHYAITSTYIEPKDNQWQTSNKIVVTKAGRYYLWVKDLVGNIGNAIPIKINDDYSGDVNINHEIIYDKGRIVEDIVVGGSAFRRINFMEDMLFNKIEDKEYNPLLVKLDELDETPATQIR